MDFANLMHRQFIYHPNAEEIVRMEVQEARNTYAVQRLLGNSQAAYGTRESFMNGRRQAKTELKGELAALSIRRKSVVNALKLLDEPIHWPLWPETNDLEHTEVMDDLMGVHRRNYRNKLDRLKTRHVGTQSQ